MTRYAPAIRLAMTFILSAAGISHTGAVACGAARPHSNACVGPAGHCGCVPRPQDQLWYINTRFVAADPTGETAAPNFQIGRYGHGQGWGPSTLAEFLSIDDPQIPTVFYVHGNRIEEDECAPRGRLVYHALACQSPNDKPLRFVIWSWPADKADGPLQDVRAKAERTELEGYYLGWLLSRISRQVRVSVIGYSFGGRITTGALHVSAGGDLDGRSLLSCGGPGSRRVRVVLLAAALPNHWLLPGQRHQRALSQVDHMLLLHNSCDYALRHYWLLEFDRRQQALGCAGLADVAHLGPAASRVVQWDACGEVGRLHDRDEYFRAPYMVDEIRRYVMWEPLGTH